MAGVQPQNGASFARAPTASHTTPIFLFVNTKSGGNKGAVFLKAPKPFNMRLESKRNVSLHIFDLLAAPSGNMPGFQALQKTIAEVGAPVRTIVGGGDGTIMWVVSEAEKHGINVRDDMLIGVVPLGTGNDFSRAAGWGGTNPKETLLDDDCAILKGMVEQWGEAEPMPHDVWQVALEVDEETGQIFQKEVDKGKKRIESPMLNYLSFGQDSEAGYDFEMNRKSSQIGNITQYAMSGMKASLDRSSSQYVKSKVRALYNGPSDASECIFSTDDSDDEDAPRLRKNPQVLLVLNIKSYAGGFAPKLWQSSTRRLGVDNPVSDNLRSELSHPGDGKLEVLTLRYAARVVTGSALGGRRVFSGAPLFFDFHQWEDEETLVFMNIDGEFYKILNPVSMTLTLKQRLQVLHSKDSMATQHKVRDDEVETDSSSSGEDDDASPNRLGFWNACSPCS